IFVQAEDGIRDRNVTGVQTCALPIFQYNLLFERFLNPERVTMPDIDMDFSDRDREDIVHYVRQKYGDKYVAKIITFDTYGTRSIIRELLERMDIEIGRAHV